MKYLLPIERIERRILFLRGHKVMLDTDLAELYGVEVKYLKRQVRRNRRRFPEDFMLELSREERASLRSHFGALKRGEHTKYSPFAFTEQGVAMLSSVLHSERAIAVNIEIMRIFAKLREMIVSNKDLARRLEELERKYDAQFKVVFQAIRQLMASPESDPPREPVGFSTRDSGARYRRMRLH